MTYAMEMTSLSSKGQVVIPQEIRDSLHLVSGTKFIVIADEEGIYLKPLVMPNRERMLKLLEKSRKFAQLAGVSEDDISGVIKDVRSERKALGENSN